MEYKEQIEQALIFIDNNLKTELNLADLARAACYSEYHFLRIFKQVTGLTPVDYIRKRRLSEIAREICKSDRPIYEIAYKYGFNSKENFTRAFKNEHNVLPTEYKSAENSLKLYDNFKWETVPFKIKPQIVTIKSFSLTVYQSTENYVPKFWNIYNCNKLSEKLSGGKITEDYCVSKWGTEKNTPDYYIGIQTKEASGDLTGTVQLEIPGGLYAVFTSPPVEHFNFVDTIHKTWKYINEVWFLENNYRKNGIYEFEKYTESSRTFSEKIYIPIAEKK